MPGGVGGAASRGVPLSRSSVRKLNSKGLDGRAPVTEAAVTRPRAAGIGRGPTPPRRGEGDAQKLVAERAIKSQLQIRSRAPWGGIDRLDIVRRFSAG